MLSHPSGRAIVFSLHIGELVGIENGIVGPRPIGTALLLDAELLAFDHEVEEFSGMSSHIDRTVSVDSPAPANLGTVSAFSLSLSQSSSRVQ